jgi:hypothetical protein
VIIKFLSGICDYWEKENYLNSDAKVEEGFLETSTPENNDLLLLLGN